MRSVQRVLEGVSSVDVNHVSAAQALCDFEEGVQCRWALDILLEKEES